MAVANLIAQGDEAGVKGLVDGLFRHIGPTAQQLRSVAYALTPWMDGSTSPRSEWAIKTAKKLGLTASHVAESFTELWTDSNAKDRVNLDGLFRWFRLAPQSGSFAVQQKLIDSMHWIMTDDPQYPANAFGPQRGEVVKRLVSLLQEQPENRNDTFVLGLFSRASTSSAWIHQVLPELLENGPRHLEDVVTSFHSDRILNRVDADVVGMAIARGWLSREQRNKLLDCPAHLVPDAPLMEQNVNAHSKTLLEHWLDGGKPFHAQSILSLIEQDPNAMDRVVGLDRNGTTGTRYRFQGPLTHAFALVFPTHNVAQLLTAGADFSKPCQTKDSAWPFTKVWNKHEGLIDLLANRHPELVEPVQTMVHASQAKSTVNKLLDDMHLPRP